MSAITVSNLGKAYKAYPSKWARLAEWALPSQPRRHTLNWILRDISFTVSPGEAIGIVGVNGAGKSTLLKIMTGTTKPTQGYFDITGTVAAMLELGMGFHPDFTGRENTIMAAQLLGIDSDEMASLMPSIQKFSEIGGYFDQPLRVYSSGMSVRLAFAVATAKRPDILIIDEALSVGDSYFQQKSFRRIRQFQADGTTLLLVSHDVAAIRSICNQAIWLDKGSVRGKGNTKDVLDSYAASLYEKSQTICKERNIDTALTNANKVVSTWRRDARQDFINMSNLRNDVKIFDLNPDASSWGDSSASITNVYMTDLNGNQLCWMIGGEEVMLSVNATAHLDIENIVLGFIVRDRLGQALFGDNTFLSTADMPINARSGQTVSAIFHFIMPILPHGSYSATAAVATGSQEDHVVNDWVDHIIKFESHNRAAVSGIVGIPMHSININVS